MYITEITLENFKNFSGPITIEFDRKFNVIVGRNGSGKTNMLEGIEFAISPRPAGPENHLVRQFANSTGTDRTPQKTVVKLVLDNCSQCFPYPWNVERVVIVREMSSKGSLHTNVKGKKTTSHIFTLLMQFSGLWTNQGLHYMQQGKITDVINFNPKQLLGLFHDVINGKMDDLPDTQLLTTKNNILIQQLAQKLKQIESKKNTLQDSSAQAQDRQRVKRELEHMEFFRDRYTLQKCRRKRGVEESKLRKCEAKLQKKCKLSDVLRNKLRNMKQKLEELIVVLDDQNACEQECQYKLATAVDALHNKKRQMEAEKNIAARKVLQDRIKEIEKTLQKNTEDLTNAKAAYNEVSKLYRDMEGQLKMTLARRDILLDQKTRHQVFPDHDNRTEHLQQEIRYLNEHIADKNKALEEFTSSLNEAKRLLMEIISQNDVALNEAGIQCNTLKAKERDYHKKTKELKQLQEQKFDLERKSHHMNSNLIRVTEHINKIYNNIIKNKSILHGIKNIHTAINSLRTRNKADVSKAYHGLLFSLFSCPENVSTAVESIAGLRLFYHVVDNRKTAMIIMKEFNRLKLSGELNFIPCDIATTQVRSVNQMDTNLIRYLEFDARFSNPLKKVFGNVLLCEESESIMEMSRIYNCACVTTDGDYALPNGAITGGYFSRENSTLRIKHELMSLEKKKNDLQTFVDINKSEILELDEQIRRISQDVEELRTKVNIRRDLVDKTEPRQGRALVDLKIKLELQIDHFLEKKHTCMTDLAVAKEVLELLTRECDATVREQPYALNEQEEVELQLSKDDILEKESSLATLSRSFWETNKEKHKLMQTERQLLLSKMDLEDRLRDLPEGEESPSASPEKSVQELEAIVNQRQEEFNKQADYFNKHKREKIKLQCDLDVELDEQATQELELQNHRQELKDITIKIAGETFYINKLEYELDRVEKPPTEAFITYGHLTPDQLMAKIVELTKKLNKMPLHRDKASIIEHIDTIMAEGGEDLHVVQSYHEEETETAAAVRNYIQPRQENMFRLIYEHFLRIFARLVPDGTAELVFRHRNGDASPPGQDIASLKGVEISASLDRCSPLQHVQALSGGEKTVVALSLVMAIQSVLPQPIMLLDELDMCLSDKYLLAALTLLKEHSERSQIICVTHNKSMLSAGTLLAVRHPYGRGTVARATIEEAIRLLENQDGVDTESEPSSQV